MNKNPHLAPFLVGDVSKTFSTIKRIDKLGYFYSIDYQEDYYHPLYVGLVKKFEELSNFKNGCSCFYCQNNLGDNLTVRNYDFAHRKNNEPKGEITGLNILIRCHPKGKHASIGVADGFWLNPEGKLYVGMLDDDKTDISNVALLPYLTMDGINDAGLTASILMVNCNKDNPNDKKTDMNDEGKLDKISHARLLRYILDNCADVKEAIELTNKYNIFSLRYSNFQIMVTDKDGHSEVFAWRFNKFTHTKSNACTNFNLSGQLDDACDVYEDNRIIDHFTRIEKTLNEYHYGYGKGFNRFETIVSSLERQAMVKEKNYKTEMPNHVAKAIIESVSVIPCKAYCFRCKNRYLQSIK